MTEPVRLQAPPELDMAVGEAIYTQRAIRRLAPDRPISDADLKTMIDAASKAPTGANVQPARMLVIRDALLIQQFGTLYHEAWWAKRAGELGWTVDQEVPKDSPYHAAAGLASEIGSAPAIVLVYSEGGPDFSVYPSVQNLLLAARALGIGSVLTTLHPTVMDRVDEMFGVPDGVRFHCCIPLGYPRGNFGTTQRLPTNTTTYWDQWGQVPPW